jgi:hypothetical protein
MSIAYQYGTGPTLQLAAQKAEEAKTRELLEYQQRMNLALFNAGLQLEAQKRAQAWELEKMELASRQDFQLQQMREQALYERDLAKYLREQDEIDASLKAIKESDILSDEDKQLAMIQVISRGEVPAFTQSAITERKSIKAVDPIEQLIMQSLQSTLPAEPGEFPEAVPTRKVGDIVVKVGKSYKIVGFDEDGEPLVEEVK